MARHQLVSSPSCTQRFSKHLPPLDGNEIKTLLITEGKTAWSFLFVYFSNVNQQIKIQLPLAKEIFQGDLCCGAREQCVEILNTFTSSGGERLKKKPFSLSRTRNSKEGVDFFVSSLRQLGICRIFKTVFLLTWQSCIGLILSGGNVGYLTKAICFYL